MNTLSATLALWLLLILGIAADACVHPLATGSAQAQTAGSSAAQAAGEGHASARRGARRLHLEVTPAADGGAPTFALDLADDGDETTAGATEALDAGASASADAGSSAAVETTPAAGFPWKFILGGVAVLVVAGGIVARKAGLL